MKSEILIKSFSLLNQLFVNRRLMWHMTKRDLSSRYKGSVLGLAWAVINPLLLLCVYTFVFSVVFKGKWRIGEHESRADFAIVLFLGLIVETFFTESINRSTGVIVSNVNYVKRVVFPLDILPLTVIGTALINASMSLLVWLIAFLSLGYRFHLSAVFFPLVFAPLILMSAGFAWAISAIGVFVRDISQTMLFITMLTAYLAPVFYPISEIPEKLRPLIMLNPIAFIVVQVREVMIIGNNPNWWGLVTYTSVALLVAVLGYALFEKTRKGFNDVL